MLANLSAVFVTLAAWLLYRQRPTLVFLIGLLLALTGTAMLMSRSRSGRNSRSANCLASKPRVATRCICSDQTAARRELRHGGHRSWGTSITALTLLPIALLSGETLLPPSLHAWAVLLALALISHAGGQTLIAYALAQLPASFSSVALLLEPLVAAVIAWPLFGEHLGPVEIAGCVLVLAGIYVSRRGSH